MVNNFCSSRKAVFAALLVITFVVFGNTFLNDWTYDDIPVIVENSDIRSLANFQEDTYPTRPLRELSYMLDYKLFGDQPAGYHLQQNLWHAANGCLLFLLMSILGVAPGYAFLGCLLFLVHPIQVESVASLGHRKELLPLFFGLLALLAYVKSFAVSGLRRWALWLTCAVSYLLVLKGNQTAGTLPLLFPVYEYLYLEKDRRLLLRYPWAFGLILLLLVGACGFYYTENFDFQQSLLQMYAQNGAPGTKEYFPLFLVALKLPLLYLGKLLWPFDLAPEYVTEFSVSYLQWGSLAGAFLFCGLLTLLVRRRRSVSGISFGLAWSLVLYIPVSNVLPVHAYAMADRYMYLVLPGVSMVVAVALQKLDAKLVNKCVVAILLVLAILTIMQNRHWKNHYSLWTHAVMVNPESKGAHWSVAASYARAGELQRAKKHFQKVLELDRFFVHAYLELAKLHEQEGDLPAAQKNYEMFVRYGQYQFPAEAMRIKNYLKFRKMDKI